MDEGGNTTISFTQSALVDSILKQLDLLSSEDELKETSRQSNAYKTKTHSMLACGITYDNREGLPQQDTRNYRCYWKAHLPHWKHMTRHVLCYESVCTVQCQSNSLPWMAVKRIGCYPLTTCGKGILALPIFKGMLKAFCDAYFSGQWTTVHLQLRESILSCTVFVISFYQYPIYWKSTLQTEVALSSMEFEYMALRYCLHEIFPLRWLLIELSEHSFICQIPLAKNIELFNARVALTIIKKIQIALLCQHPRLTVHALDTLLLNITRFMMSSRKDLLLFAILTLS